MKTLFNHLIGTWKLERHIVDALGRGQLIGTSVFSEIDEGQLDCQENGILTYNGGETEAKRSYIYKYQNNKIVILYNDPYRSGDVLHELDFVEEDGKQIANHCHLCGQDTYALKFSILEDGRIQMDYRVKGPHKNYQIHSVLTRIPA